MTLRRVAGAAAAAAAFVSLVLHVLSWLGLPKRVDPWTIFLGIGLAIASSVYASHVLKPYYTVDRVMQLHRLKPFFSTSEYQSIWIAFSGSIVAAAIAVLGGIDRADGGGDQSVLGVCSAVWFSFFYIDAMIFLRARLPARQ